MALPPSQPQTYAYDATILAALRASLSEPRFASYLRRAGGNEQYAIALYLYNSRLAESLLFPIGVAEVVVRNAIDHSFSSHFGNEWPFNANFREKFLTPESLDSLDRAIRRSESRNRDQVVAELTFDFWSNLFRKTYADYWRTNANRTFPNLQRGFGRRELQKLVRDVNHLRNRIAHHEPILDVNAPDTMSRIIQIVELRCKITAEWMKSNTNVNRVIRSRPTPDTLHGELVSSKIDSKISTMATGDKLIEVAQRLRRGETGVVCMNGKNIAGIITTHELAVFLSNQAESNGWMLDLEDHTAADILHLNERSFHTASTESDLKSAIDILNSKKATVVIGLDTTGHPVGVILKAHRRY